MLQLKPCDMLERYQHIKLILSYPKHFSIQILFQEWILCVLNASAVSEIPKLLACYSSAQMLAC